MNGRPRLRVVIDSRLRNGEPGGVQQVVVGLARGLSRVADPSGEEYLFLAWAGHSAWLDPFVSGACRVVTLPASRLRAAGRWVQKRARAMGWFGARPSGVMRIAAADRAVEALRPDVLHFPLQRAFLTSVPSIYQPHDLQHVHLPHLFTAGAHESRDRVYRAYCNQATTVVVMSRWGREDLVNHLDLPVTKVAVIPWAPLVGEYAPPDAARLEAVRRTHRLPREFAYFPAHTFPHKNHLRLLEALARLRDAGLVVPLVCSGGRNEYFRVIRKAIRRLALDAQVRFVGFVPPDDVAALYRLCRAVVFPTLFEGWGLPLSEALAAGVPVACSAVTCLPEQASGAAVLFDPNDVADIATAVRKVWTDERARADLTARGRGVVAALDWSRTANLFRAHYRRAAGHELSAREAGLLEEAPVC
ncbi:MAG: glycosyltransferase family 4 protein [Bacteroidales bacterium]